MSAVTIFSEYEVNEIGIILTGQETGETTNCIGSAEETMDAKTVVKKCRGVETKSRTKGTGTGEVKLSLHMPYDLFASMYGMKLDSLKDGVLAYGENSSHKPFCLTEKVLDEDDNVKYKAYPNAQIKEGFSRKVENGADEVAEIELTIAVMPDDYGNGVYEALGIEANKELTANWMTKFTPDLMQAVTV